MRPSLKITRRPLAGGLLATLLLALAPLAWAAEGLIRIESPLPPAETMDRVQATVEARGLTVFARIDHAAGAATVDMDLRPTQLLIFGNPKGGTPFMQCAQSIGIDLPLKLLVWQDADGTTWLGWNDPVWIAARHGAGDCPAAETLRQALAGLAQASLAP